MAHFKKHTIGTKFKVDILLYGFRSLVISVLLAVALEQSILWKLFNAVLKTIAQYVIRSMLIFWSGIKTSLKEMKSY